MSKQPALGAKRGVGITRRMVLRYAQEGMTQAEIGRKLGISRQAVHDHLRRRIGAKNGVGVTREQVRKFWLAGLTKAEIARVLEVSPRTVRIHLEKLREAGELEERAS